MSLNKFTDVTTIKPYLKIGCEHLRCNRLDVEEQLEISDLTSDTVTSGSYTVLPAVAGNILVTNASGLLVPTPYTAGNQFTPTYGTIADTIQLMQQTPFLVTLPLDVFSQNMTKAGDGLQIDFAGLYNVTFNCDLNFSNGGGNFTFVVRTGVSANPVLTGVQYMAVGVNGQHFTINGITAYNVGDVLNVYVTCDLPSTLTLINTTLVAYRIA